MGPESTLSPGESPPAEPLLVPGQQLGKYQLIKRLAVGGMAEIFLARVVGLEGFEKLVVLKSILASHAADEAWVQMFLEEARLAATLQHPNIAQVFDVGRHGQVHFFTMEYVQGADLRLIMKAAEPRGGVPLEAALAIVAGAAAGLHYAHEKSDPDGRPLGIVHRDVSPANVVVSEDGAVKVVDFGIAKAAVRRAATRTGTIKGKAGWISPEQCRGEPLDRRSDIFSLGILLYELTCSVPPFRGENEYAILRQIVEQDAPPPRTVRPDYPPGLEAIAMRCLRRNRDDRYATAQELQIDLETFARQENLTLSSVELARLMEDLFGKGGLSDDPARAAAGTRAPLLVRPAFARRGRTRWLWAAVGLAAIAAAGLWFRSLSSSRSRAPIAGAPVVVERPAPPAPAEPAAPAARPAAVEPPVAVAPGAAGAAPPPAERSSTARAKSAVATAKRRRVRRPDPPSAAAPRRPARAEPDPDAPFPR